MAPSSRRRPTTSAAAIQTVESPSTFEFIQATASIPTRRLRPTDLYSSADELRIPLKPEKMRRESLLGLRNLFSRSLRKESMASIRDVAAASALGNTLATVVSNESVQNPPVATSEVKSSLSPSSSAGTLHVPTRELTVKASGILRGTFEGLSSALSPKAESHFHSISKGKSGKAKKPTIVIDTHMVTSNRESTFSPGSPPDSVPIPRLPSSHGERQAMQGQLLYKTGKAPIATWDPPPLFRAYPQAIKHSRLPASSVSADSVLRAHEKKTAAKEAGAIINEVDPENAAGDEPAPTISLRKSKSHRRNPSLPKFEWTYKIYILVTSGYLLQYSGEGAYDRLPEKVLHLGKESAAFAADVFPGKHWVLQVSSAMDSAGTIATDSRSLFSRLLEKRHANNFLMVFENGDDMTSWITVLRREIEALGGKKLVSETGEVASEELRNLRAQASQRTLVVRDPARFSKSLSVDQLSTVSWNSYSNRNSTSDVDIPSPVAEKGDDESTNSLLSHDGRQLDSLRDNPNRVSVVSSVLSSISAPRTVGSSSPSCSPTRSTFASYVDGPSTSTHDTSISNKRQSAQSLSSLRSFSVSNGDSARPRGSLDIPNPNSSNSNGTHSIPNFSVPNSASRRFSVARSPSADTLSFKDAVRVSNLRKMPPPALRTLPTVEDSPVGFNKLSATSTTTNTVRSPVHIAQCFTPNTAESPVTPSFGGFTSSSKTSRVAQEKNSLRSVTLNLSSPTAGSFGSGTQQPHPRRHNSTSTRLTRTSSVTNSKTVSHGPRSRTHIASLISPISTMPGSPRATRFETPKLRGPPVSMDKVSMSPKKGITSIHPSLAQAQNLRRSFVLEASEAPRRSHLPTPVIMKRASYQTEPSYHTATISSINRARSITEKTTTLKEKPSLTVLLPEKTLKEIPPQGLCSVYGGLPSALDPPIKLSSVFHPKTGWAYTQTQADRKGALNTGSVNRQSMPIMSAPPAPPPTCALPPLPTER